MRFTLRKLGYLEAALKSGSISAAAAKLHVSETSISTAIDEMELLTSLQLFERRPAKGISITDSGREVERHVVKFLEKARELDAALASLKARAVGGLRIACYAPVARHVLPPFLHRLRLRHPDVQLHIEEHDMQVIEDLIADRSIDLAMTFQRNPESGRSFTPFFVGRPYILMPSRSPIAAKSAIRLEDLAGQPIIALSMPFYEDYIRSLFGAVGLVPTIAQRTKSPSAVRAMVGAGFGYSILNTYTPDDRSDDKGYVARPLADQVWAPAFGVHCVTSQVNAPLVCSAVEIVAELVAEGIFDPLCLSMRKGA